jgi:ADP-ribose pyrophosphatase YjhB (NUDIX family)
MECKTHRLVADIALIAQRQVLLVRYHDVSRYDGQRGWFLPDDYLAHGEHPEASAKRIAEDQAGIVIPACTLGDIESFANGAWHMIFHYRAELDETPPVYLGDNVAAGQWFPLDELPDRSDFAHHGWAVEALETMGIISPTP